MDNKQYYPSIISTIDLVVFGYNKESNKLMVYLDDRKNPNEPYFNYKSLIGGFVRFDDVDMYSAICRIVSDKTQYVIDDLSSCIKGDEPSFVVGNNHRDPRGWALSHVYCLFVSINDTNKHHFYDVEQLLTANHTQLAFDHLDIIRKAVDWIANTSLSNHQYAITASCSLLPVNEDFVLSQLQKVYECITQSSTNTKTFRRKMDDIHWLNGKIIDGNVLQGKRSRPAQLYQYKP
jgi:hydrolase, NUDIX family